MTSSDIASAACQSGIGRVTSPIALWQSIAQLSSSRPTTPPAPPPEDLFVDLQGYWNGTSPDPDYGSISSFDPSDAMTWGAGGPNGGGAGNYLGVTVGNLQAINGGFGAMVTGPSTVNLFWQLSSGTDPKQSIFGYGSSRYDVLADLSSPSDDTFFLDYADDTCGSHQSSSTIPNVPLPWIMFTLVMTQTSIQLYVDGVLRINEAASLWCTDSSLFRIGSWIGAWTWDGYVSNIGFWTRTLSQSEIEQLYNLGLGLTASEL